MIARGSCGCPQRWFPTVMGPIDRSATGAAECRSHGKESRLLRQEYGLGAGEQREARSLRRRANDDGSLP